MLDYISGFIYIFWILCLCYFLGTAITNQKSFTTSLLVGYIGYSFVLAVGFIIIQLLGLPWRIALIYFIVSILVMIIFIMYRLKKNDFKITKNEVLNGFKNNYALFLITFILLILSFANVHVMWLNNHLDDGYYIGRISHLASYKNPYYYNFPVGLDNRHQFNSYLFDVWQLEASVYTNILHMNVFPFCRVFLNFQNYLLLVVTVCEFAKRTVCKLSGEFNKYAQWTPIILFVFTILMIVATNCNLMILQDYWQFSSAMYLGSSIPRTMGILWVLVFFIDNEKIMIKHILQLIVMSVVLVSKSSIAIPIVFVAAIATLISVYTQFNKKGLIAFGTLVLLVVLGMILPNKEDIYANVEGMFMSNLKSIVFLAFVLVYIFAFAIIRKPIVFKVTEVLVLITGFMLIPGLCNVYQTLSVYYFVALRVLTCLFYTIYIVGFVFLLYGIFTITSEMLTKGFILLMSVIFLFMSSLSYFGARKSMIHFMEVVIQNPKLVPNSIYELGQKLDKISNGEKLYTLMPQFVTTDGYLTSLAIIATSVSDDVVSVSAIPRYAMSSINKVYSKFTLDQQSVFENFNASKDRKSFDALIPILDEYSIQCFVLEGKDNAQDSYNDYYKVDTVNDDRAGTYYSIYVKR